MADGMARDRPSPYEKGDVFFTRDRSYIPGMARDRPSPYEKGHRPWPVARGPVPRDRCMARDRPSPYDERTFFHCPPRSRPTEKN